MYKSFLSEAVAEIRADVRFFEGVEITSVTRDYSFYELLLCRL